MCTLPFKMPGQGLIPARRMEKRRGNEANWKRGINPGPHFSAMGLQSVKE